MNKILSLSAVLFVAYGASAAATENVTNLIARLDSLTANVMTNYLMLADVPRPTYGEKAVSDRLVEWATRRGFATMQDAQANVWFDVPATAGLETLPLTILQGHLDMVCVGFDDPKNEVPVIDCDADGVLHSLNRRTSIGADDGVGVAMAMTVADGLVPHGPVRVLLTTDEELTQTGAKSLDPSVLTAAAYLVNIDCEEDGEVTISSAACDDLTVTGGVTTTGVTQPSAWRLSIAGFRGGHSGLDIHKGHLNANVEIGHLLTNMLARGIAFELAELTGGDAPNAIAPHAEATVCLDAKDLPMLSNLLFEVQQEYRTRGETSATVGLSATNGFTAVISSASRTRLLNFLTRVHNGVWSMSEVVPGLVETSVNLGVVAVTTTGVKLFSAIRGSVEKSLQDELRSIQETAGECGYDCSVRRACAPWPANPDNPLISIMTNAWREVAGDMMKIVAVHGGLECGWFAQKAPGLNICSVGPTLVRPHTVNEQIGVGSISNCMRFVARSLAALPPKSPRVKLGVVAQRYPWNGLVDVVCNVADAPENAQLVVCANGVEVLRLPAKNGEQKVSFDAKNVDALRDRKIKGVRITAKVVTGDANF